MMLAYFLSKKIGSKESELRSRVYEEVAKLTFCIENRAEDNVSVNNDRHLVKRFLFFFHQEVVTSSASVSTSVCLALLRAVASRYLMYLIKPCMACSSTALDGMRITISLLVVRSMDMTVKGTLLLQVDAPHAHPFASRPHPSSFLPLNHAIRQSERNAAITRTELRGVQGASAGRLSARLHEPRSKPHRAEGSTYGQGQVRHLR